MQSFNFFKTISSTNQTSPPPVLQNNNNNQETFVIPDVIDSSKPINHGEVIQPLQLSNSITTPIIKQQTNDESKSEPNFKEKTEEKEENTKTIDNIVLKNEINFVNYFAPTPNQTIPKTPLLQNPIRMTDNVFVIDSSENVQYFSEPVKQINLYKAGLAWRSCNLPFVANNYDKYINSFEQYLSLKNVFTDINYECYVNLGLIYVSFVMSDLDSLSSKNISNEFKEIIANKAKEYLKKASNAYMTAASICGDRAEPVFYLYLCLQNLNNYDQFKEYVSASMKSLYERLKTYNKNRAFEQYYTIDNGAYEISELHRKEEELKKSTKIVHEITDAIKSEITGEIIDV